MKTILIADDEPVVLTMVSLFLEKAGYASLKAVDGVHAMDILRDNPGIDALISDIRMPGMTGFELGRAVRAMDPSIPILLMSGFAGHTREDSQGLFEQPNIQFLSKPFTSDQLLASLDMLLEMQIA